MQRVLLSIQKYLRLGVPNRRIVLVPISIIQ